jgi:thermopsin
MKKSRVLEMSSLFVILFLGLASLFVLKATTQTNYSSLASSKETTQGTSDPYNATLSPNDYQPIAVEAIENGMQLSFDVQSDVIVHIYVMNATQFEIFSRIGENNALYSCTSNSLSDAVTLGSTGTYFLVIDNDISGTTANVTYSYHAIPVDIYDGYSSAPVPTGIADYGEENESGHAVPYTILTKKVIGHAEIYSLGAYNGTQTLANPYGASLQLNIVLQINTTFGQRDYWLQDVADFITNSSSLFFTDNIWNFSLSTANMSAAYVSGLGKVSYYNITIEYYYGCSTLPMSYSFPLSFTLPISFSASSDSVNVTFAYQILKNGQGSSAQNIVNYDTATINATGITNSSIIISGYEQTPSNHYYDAELVFGGEFNGEVTTFTQMNSTLEMYYLMSNGDTITPYSVYEFGSDTAEGAYNLETVVTNGVFTIVIGQPNLYQSYTIPFISSLLMTDAGIHTIDSATVTISGGVPPYTYQVYLDGSPFVNYTSYSTSYSFNIDTEALLPGQHLYFFVITDSSGLSSISYQSVVLVNLDPTISAINSSYSDNPFLVNAFVLFIVKVSGGTAPFKYTWMDNGATVDQMTTNNSEASYTYRFSLRGQQNLVVNVTDAIGCKVATQPVLVSYGYNYETIESTIAVIIVILVVILVVISLKRKKGANTTVTSTLEPPKTPELSVAEAAAASTPGGRQIYE